LREQDIASVVPRLLQLLANQQQLKHSDPELQQLVCQWLAQFGESSYSMVSAGQLVAKADNHPPQVTAQLEQLLMTVDFSSTIGEFNSSP
jgi:hypothetical protein